VLLVDDNPQHRIPLLRALRDQGHSVLHSADGPSGEALCRASQFEIDVLVACADMKRMCGFKLAHRVRRMHPTVRVLLMWRRLERPEEARRAYACGYAVIQEPFTPEELCRRLTGLLGSAGSGACTQTRPDGEHRLMPHEGEALPIGSKKDN
jgi:DNA-binding response OmpR family regulator